MKKSKTVPFFDDEEKALIESAETVFDRSDFKPADAERRARLNAEWKAGLDRTTARKPVTLRLQQRDIARLKAIASRKGMPYQTLVSSVLHQFANGDLVER